MHNVWREGLNSLLCNPSMIRDAVLGVNFCALQLNAVKVGLQALNHYFSHLLGTWQRPHH